MPIRIPSARYCMYNKVNYANKDPLHGVFSVGNGQYAAKDPLGGVLSEEQWTIC